MKTIILFIVLGLFDLYMTINHTVVDSNQESNPIAKTIMGNTNKYGPAGGKQWNNVKLIIYKITVTLAVILSVRKVATVRPRTAKCIMGFGIGLYMSVALWHLFIVYIQIQEANHWIEMAKPGVLT